MEEAIRLEPEERALIVKQEPARELVEKDAVNGIERGTEGGFAIDRVAMTVWQTGHSNNGLRTGKAQRHPGQRIRQAAHVLTVSSTGSNESSSQLGFSWSEDWPVKRGSAWLAAREHCPDSDIPIPNVGRRWLSRGANRPLAKATAGDGAARELLMGLVCVPPGAISAMRQERCGTAPAWFWWRQYRSAWE